MTQASASPRPSRSRSDTITASVVISVDVDSVVSTDVDCSAGGDRVNDRDSSPVVVLVVSGVEDADPVTATGSDKVSPD